MSRLDQLVQKLCPDGVEYVHLLDVADVLYGYPCDSSKFNEDGEGVPLVRIRDVLHGITTTYTTEEIPNEYLVNKGDLLVGMDGNFHVGNWKSAKSILCQRVCKISPKTEPSTVLNRFLSHLLVPIIKKVEDNKHSGTVKHLLAKDLKTIKIPLLPFEIQQEIVDILDRFTELEVELETKLEAEREAREKQYAYYRDALLDFSPERLESGHVSPALARRLRELCPNGVEYKNFYEVASYTRGVTYRKTSEIYDKDDGYLLLRANNINLSDYSLNYDNIIKISFSVKIKDSQFLHRDDILICAGSGSKEHIGKVAYIKKDTKYSFGGFMGVIRCNSSLIEPRFLFHILTSSIFKKHLKEVTNTSTINNINNDTWKRWSIPLPPLEIQQEIVNILDRFDALAHDITSGLPAELAARRKQYEHYRDKLLAFEPRDKA